MLKPNENSRATVLVAVKVDGHALRDASNTLKNDREVVLVAVKQSGHALQYASEALKNDREIVLAAMKQNRDYGYNILRYASETLKNDREVMLVALKQSGNALEYASEALKNDRGIVLVAVKQDGRALLYASEALKNDREVVLVAVNQNGRALEYAAKTLKNDREVVLVAVAKDGWALIYVSEALRNDREVVLVAVKQYGHALRFVLEIFKNDREVVLVAVKRDGSAIEYASEALRNDREVVLAAMKQNGYHSMLQYASETLKNDKDFVLVAVKQSGQALEYISEALKNDREVVLAAMKQDGRALQYVSEALKNDKDFVLVAMKQDGHALQFASQVLKNNKDFLLAAMKQNGYGVFQYASDILKNDKEIVLVAVKQDGRALTYASKTLKNDREVVLVAVKQNGHALEYAPETLKNDLEIVLVAVKQNGYALEYTSETLKNDREIVLVAMKQNGYAVLQYASEALKNDKGCILAAVKQDGRALHYAPEALKNDREIVLAAIKQNGYGVFQYASDVLKNEKEIVLVAVKQDGRALAYASETLKNDREIVLTAIKQNGYALEYASGTFKNDREIVLAAVAKDGWALQYASAALKNDRGFVLVAVATNSEALQCASVIFKNDPNFMIAVENAKMVIDVRKEEQSTQEMPGNTQATASTNELKPLVAVINEKKATTTGEKVTTGEPEKRISELWVQHKRTIEENIKAIEEAKKSEKSAFEMNECEAKIDSLYFSELDKKDCATTEGREKLKQAILDELKIEEITYDNCKAQVIKLSTSFRSDVYSYSPEQLTTACSTPNGRELVTSFGNQLATRQREQENFRVGREPKNINTTLVLGMLLSSVGAIFFLVLLYRWLWSGSPPRDENKSRTINRKLIEEAIENQDFEMLRFILKSGHDIRGWSFVGMDLEWLEPITIDELRGEGVIVDLEGLLRASKEALATPGTNRRYISRILWGIQRLLAQWIKPEPEISESLINQLNIIAIAELGNRYKAHKLPYSVLEYINKKREEQFEKVFSQWRKDGLSEKKSGMIDELIVDSLWIYWIQSKETNALNKILTSHIKENFNDRLLKRFKSNDLPRIFLDAWKIRLVEHLYIVFDDLETPLSDGLRHSMAENVAIIVKEKYKGRIPREVKSLYIEAINRLLEAWLANHTTEGISAEIDMLATNVREDMQLDPELRARVEKEALSVIVSDHKQKDVPYDEENLIGRQIYFIFSPKLSTLCAELESHPLYDLQEQATMAAIDNGFKEWKDNPDWFNDIALIDLLPEYREAAEKLKSSQNELESIRLENALLKKEIEALRSSSAAARQVGLMSSPNTTTQALAAANNQVSLQPEDKKKKRSFSQS